ncbi:hypothetical protein Drorol1_Dr00013436 [Drosera rotundifolia]
MRFLQFSRNLAISSRLGFRNMMTSRRAVVVPRFGDPDNLEIRDHVEVPNLKPHKVLAKARAVSVNPLDLRSVEAVQLSDGSCSNSKFLVRLVVRMNLVEWN